MIATANPGLLMSVATTRATRGTFESDVKDAKLVATWGVMAWRASAPAGHEGRGPHALRQHQDAGRGVERVVGAVRERRRLADHQPEGALSPVARGAHRDRGAAPMLTSVSSAYLPRNIRPQVSSITVHPPGVVFQKPFSSGETEIAGLDEDAQDKRAAASATGGGAPALGRRTFQRGLQTFVWKADDENSDELSYDVFYRREGETAWRSLKSDLRDTLLVWDTSSVPNGTYVLKVLASDRRSNPADIGARRRAREQQLRDRQRGAGRADRRAAPRRRALHRAREIRDTDSAVMRVEYSLDAQRWQPAFPRDGILDGRQEGFEIRLDAEAAGRTLVIRATDALGNVGTGQIKIQ